MMSLIEGDWTPRLRQTTPLGGGCWGLEMVMISLWLKSLAPLNATISVDIKEVQLGIW
jgi:hypothetical protein